MRLFFVFIFCTHAVIGLKAQDLNLDCEGKLYSVSAQVFDSKYESTSFDLIEYIYCLNENDYDFIQSLAVSEKYKINEFLKDYNPYIYSYVTNIFDETHDPYKFFHIRLWNEKFPFIFPTVSYKVNRELIVQKLHLRESTPNAFADFYFDKIEFEYFSEGSFIKKVSTNNHSYSLAGELKGLEENVDLIKIAVINPYHDTLKMDLHIEY